MNDLQLQKLKQAEEILREHFDSFVLTFHDEDVTDDGVSETSVCWKGSIMTALGLATYAQHKLKMAAWSPEDEKERREMRENDDL